MMADEECAPAEFAFQTRQDGDQEVEDDENLPDAAGYKRYLVQYASITESQLITFGRYHEINAIVMLCISHIAAKRGFSDSPIKRRLDVWLFDAAHEIPFLGDSRDKECPNSMWRTAHRFGEWAQFAVVALRLITCTTSEMDADRLFSVQRNVAGLRATRFGLPTMEARLREWASRPKEIQTNLEAMEESEDLDDSGTE
jgi:hypothetical protein